jgi:superoxide dismutase
MLTLVFAMTAGQAWNHDFYWKSMKKNGGGQPTGKLLEMITSSFGSFDNFKKEFATAGNTAFGSGWAWLVHDGQTLKVYKTIGADNPLPLGHVSDTLQLFVTCNDIVATSISDSRYAFL